MKTSRLFLFSVPLLSASFVLSGCLAQNSNTPQPSAAPNTTTEKSGVSSFTGTLQVQGKTATLMTASGAIPLESYELDFSEYAGKSVTVEGKYSGDTLFVNSITE